jgi:endonuclease G, mitochondrial
MAIKGIFKQMIPAATAITLLSAPIAKTNAETITLEFDKWTIDYSCDHKGYEYFTYQAQRDSGELERYKPFHSEARLPKRCRQKATSSYRLPKGSQITYDRGHGVHQNIWDHSRDLMKQSNSMANIVPQASLLNRRGAWRYTEKLTECWRDKGLVTVYGGVVWGSNKKNDHFKKSHGVTTPDFLWKLIKYYDGGVEAWLFPNDNAATVNNIDDYLVAPRRLEKITKKIFDIPQSLKKGSAKKTRGLPRGCSIK